MEDRLKSLEVPLDRLRWTCDPDSLGVESTKAASHLDEQVIAQERAVSALKFGVSMGGGDYNIFVAGAPRTGLTYLTRTYLQETAKDEEKPLDWCYVHNFKNPDKPQAISLPAGTARELARDMDELVEDLTAQIPELFTGDEYRHRREELVKKFTAERNALLSALEAEVNRNGFILNMSQEGMMIIPSKDGQPLTEEDLKGLDEAARNTLRETSEALQSEMNNTVVNIRRLEKNLKEKNRDLDRRIALGAVGYMIDELQEKYEGQRAVISYLLGVKNDVVKNLSDFKQKEHVPTPFPMPPNEPDFTRYKVNVFIDNSECCGAPVVYETNPTPPNLMGAMERRASFGALFTDFTMIRPGSLHRANGGYLVIRARELLKWMISWEALKRALKNQAVTVEDPHEMMGMIATKSMQPDPIPLKVKVILIGEPFIYHLLYEQDNEFSKLFKVKVHLDDQVNREDEGIQKYISFAAQVVERYGLPHLSKHGLSRLLEYGSALAGRQKKLTLKMAYIRDIIREAGYWAKSEQKEMVDREDVDQAIRHKKFRSSLTEDRMQEFVLDGYVNVDTTGVRTGQINGLSVYDLGDYSFGKPSRITASVTLGRQGITAIDRESKLSGNIHTKGVLIMEGYLRSRYAQERPLSLNASLVFEQSYGMVDGDSASAAELFALLSRLADVGIKQSFAVTGAISQQGEIQPIGGVNQKVEGFFELCRARGLTGDQGVIIPKANVPDLMLKGQVIDAVREGQFKVYAVEHADEALELLAGMPAGQRGDDREFPEGTFNRLVEERLRVLNEKAAQLMKDASDGDKGGGRESGGCDGCDA